MNKLAFHGNFIWTESSEDFVSSEDSFLLCSEEGKIECIQKEQPHGIKIIDLGEGLVIPAFTDLHLHSAQLSITGLGCDGTADQWFNEYCHPAENSYEKAETYQLINYELVKKLKKHGTLHACIMSSVSKAATIDLAERLEKSGISAYLGKMNSDYSEDGKPNETFNESIRDTIDLIQLFKKFKHTKYIISPEYIPACSDALLQKLGSLALEYNIPVQSHMNESHYDTGIVKARYPDLQTYSSVYNKYNLFGNTKTIMAHCTYAEESAISLMTKKGVYLAYCPFAISHIPNDKYLNIQKCIDLGMKIGLGSDIGGGNTLSMQRVIIGALLVSKLSGKVEPLKLSEAFFLATKGGGSFFGNTGSFEKGYYFDALMINDKYLAQYRNYSMKERIARYIYCGSSDDICKYIIRGRIEK